MNPLNRSTEHLMDFFSPMVTAASLEGETGLNNAHLSPNHSLTLTFSLSLNVFIGTKAIFCILL